MSGRLSRPAAVAALLVAASGAGWPALGQESVFNLPLPGLPTTGESVRSRGMGGVSGGLTGEVFSLDNPAWLADFERAGLYLSLLGQRTTAEDQETTGEFEDVVRAVAERDPIERDAEASRKSLLELEAIAVRITPQFRRPCNRGARRFRHAERILV